jgi:hypothetical protein
MCRAASESAGGPGTPIFLSRGTTPRRVSPIVSRSNRWARRRRAASSIEPSPSASGKIPITRYLRSIWIAPMTSGHASRSRATGRGSARRIAPASIWRWATTIARPRQFKPRVKAETLGIREFSGGMSGFKVPFREGTDSRP